MAGHDSCTVHGWPCISHGAGLAVNPEWYMASPESNVVQGQLQLIFMYYVYVLKSHLDDKLYIGYTTNLENRLREHENGEVISTRTRRPFELIFYESYRSMQDAKRREKYFKTSKGKSSLRMMLRDSLK